MELNWKSSHSLLRDMWQTHSFEKDIKWLWSNRKKELTKKVVIIQTAWDAKSMLREAQTSTDFFLSSAIGSEVIQATA